MCWSIGVGAYPAASAGGTADVDPADVDPADIDKADVAGWVVVELKADGMTEVGWAAF